MTELDARYGRRPAMGRRRRIALVVGGLAAAVIAVTAFYFWWASAQDPFRARIQTYEVVSDARIDVTVEVINDSDALVRCEVVARDLHTQPVGTVMVQTAPGPRVQLLRTQVPTTARAMVAQVGACTLVPTPVP